MSLIYKFSEYKSECIWEFGGDDSGIRETTYRILKNMCLPSITITNIPHQYAEDMPLLVGYSHRLCMFKLLTATIGQTKMLKTIIDWMKFKY